MESFYGNATAESNKESTEEENTELERTDNKIERAEEMDKDNNPETMNTIENLAKNIDAETISSLKECLEDGEAKVDDEINGKLTPIQRKRMMMTIMIQRMMAQQQSTPESRERIRNGKRGHRTKNWTG